MPSGVVMVPGWNRFKNRIFITFHKWMILNHIPIPEKMVNNNTYRGVMVQSMNRFQNAAMTIPDAAMMIPIPVPIPAKRVITPALMPSECERREGEREDK